MRRILISGSAICVILLTMFALTISVKAEDVYVNNKKIEVPTVIENGRLLVPVRGVFEALNYDVTYDADLRVAHLYGECNIVITSGDPYFMRNGELIWPDVPQRIINSRFYLPLRAVSEALGATVEWNELTRTAYIHTKVKEESLDTPKSFEENIALGSAEKTGYELEVTKMPDGSEHISETSERIEETYQSPHRDTEYIDHAMYEDWLRRQEAKEKAIAEEQRIKEEIQQEMKQREEERQREKERQREEAKQKEEAVIYIDGAEMEQELFRLVNEERAKEGLAPYIWDDALGNAAYKHAGDMAKNGYFSHTNLEGEFPVDRIKKEGGVFKVTAENISMSNGPATPEVILQGLMNSPGHRKNIMSSYIEYMGVGFYYSSSSGFYWVQCFGVK